MLGAIEVVLQSGSFVQAAARLEKKNKDTSSGTKRDIMSGVW